MEVLESSTEKAVLLRIIGRLDATTFAKFEERLNQIMNSGCKNIHIDLDKMDFVSSTGLRIFLIGLKKMTELKGNFVLYNLQHNIKEVFEISGFTNLFHIVENKKVDINNLTN